jgi:outer membrane protein
MMKLSITHKTAMLTLTLTLTLALALAAAAPAAFSQQAGSWTASGGLTSLHPSVSSGNLSAPSLPNTQATVDSNTQPTGAVNYMYTDNLAVHVPLGFGFKHNVIGTGAIAGTGVIATTKALPVTVLAQYRFMEANAQYRPYLGAGLTYAKFYDTNGTAALTAMTNPGGASTKVSFASKLVPTFQLGAVINIDAQWYVDLAYSKTLLKTTGTLSTGQTLDMTLNPSTYTVGLGYKF